MNKEKVYTLVTGTSNGIGKAFAEEAAARGWNVLLVALPEPALTEATTHLQAQYPNQHFDSLGVILMKKEAPEQILAWCKQNNYSSSHFHGHFLWKNYEELWFYCQGKEHA